MRSCCAPYSRASSENGHAVRLARNLRSGSDDSDGADRLPGRPAFRCPSPIPRRCSSASSRLAQSRSAASPPAWSAPSSRWSSSALFFLNHRAAPGYDTVGSGARCCCWRRPPAAPPSSPACCGRNGSTRSRGSRSITPPPTRLSAALDQVDIGIVLLDRRYPRRIHQPRLPRLFRAVRTSRPTASRPSSR